MHPLSVSPDITPLYKNGRRLIKLRSSCDACGAAKVRCSKQHPQCDRCISMEISCIYGQSQKCGKASRRKITGDVDKSPRNNVHDAFFGPTYYPEAGVQGMQTLNTKNEEATRVWPGDEISQWSLPNRQTDCKSFSSTEPVANSAFPLEQDSITFPTPSPVDIEPSEIHKASAANDAFDFCFPHGIDLLDFPYATHVNSLGMPQISFQASKSTNRQLDQPSIVNSNSDSRTYNCYQRAYSALESLYFRTQSSSSEIFSPNHSSIQALDSVLSCTKAATNEVFALLDCPSSQDPHLAMLYASITSKILICYQAAAGYKFLSSCNSDPESPLKANSSSIPIPIGPRFDFAQAREIYLAPSTGLDVAPIQITLGTFGIDEKDQEYLTKQLLLRELKRSGQLIEAFSVHGSHGGDAVDYLYSSLGMWLKNELIKTAEMLKS